MSTLDGAALASTEQAGDLVALDDAMSALARLDPRKSASGSELRFLAGSSVEETAEVLKVSPRHGQTRLEHCESLAVP